MKEVYQYERDRQTEAIERIKQARDSEINVLNKQMQSLKSEKLKKDQEVIKLKE